MYKSFTVKDAANRTWGTFEVARSDHGEVHGYLKATPEFEQVRETFLEHERAFFDADCDTEMTGRKIVGLGAYLIDNESGARIDIGNVIFIDENLLVSCELKL